VLHVGLPKSGTSFVQGVMRDNADALAEAGFVLPDYSGQGLFLAVLHLTDRSATWGRSEAEGERAWQRIVAGTAKHPTGATTIISSETLCLATPAQISQIVADLGEVDIDVVVTVRDLARQVPAEYQEGVKHGRKMSYPAFLRITLAPDPPRQQARRQTRRRFWNAQDPVGVLDRWAEAVGPQRVHLVTTPPPGASREELWQRFASAFGAEQVPVRMPEVEANTSLGAVQIEVLRQVNRRVSRQGREAAYGDVVKRLYAGTILRGQAGEKLCLPARYEDRVRAIAEEWVATLGQRGYHVAGDLADLVPAPGLAGTPVKVSNARALASALDATGELLAEVERLREENRELRGAKPRARALRKSALTVLSRAES
jgi:hypothetical protein